MVNATVDNKPVSIVLDQSQSTTVPSNETWRVSIHLGHGQPTIMTIDGIGRFTASATSSQSNDPLSDVTLVGGQTIDNLSGQNDSVIFITGFVVNS